MKIYGGFAGTEASLGSRKIADVHTTHKSILDGSQGVASYHVVSNTIAVSNATLLDGFTISGGKTLMSNSSSLGANYYGAGIYNSLGNPVFNNLIITGNNAVYGGGMMILGGTVTLTNTQFIGNTTTGTNGRAAGLYLGYANANLDSVSFENNVVTAGTGTYAGALMNYGVLNMSNTVFKNNRVEGTTYAQGGAYYHAAGATSKISKTSFVENTALTGGALYSATGVLELTDVSFIRNTATGAGGALYSSSANAVLDRVSFIANESVQHGGAFYLAGATKLDNVIFSRNKVTSTGAFYGGAIYASANASLINVTFSGNSVARATAGGGALYRTSGAVTIYNSILWGNTYGASLPDQISGVVTIDQSIVQGNYPAGTNIVIGDPLFVNAAADNLRLKGGSPAIDMGNNAKISTAKDLDGNPRLINETVDMGAYENQGTASLIIAPLSLSAYNRGDVLEVPLTVTGSTNVLTWKVTSGNLPSGVVLKPNGALSGRPMVAGTYIL